MTTSLPTTEIQSWPIDRFVPYARNPRKNDGVVDRMCSSIREFGFKIPVLARSDGSVVGGHAQIKISAQVGFMAGRRHDMHPSDPLRRMDRSAGQSFSITRQPIRHQWQFLPVQ